MLKRIITSIISATLIFSLAGCSLINSEPSSSASETPPAKYIYSEVQQPNAPHSETGETSTVTAHSSSESEITENTTTPPLTDEKSDESSDDLMTVSISEALTSTAPPTQETEQPSIAPPPAEDAPSYHTAAEIPSDSVSGKIRNVFYTSSDKYVIISADNLYLYDISSGSVAALTTRETFDVETYFAVSNGYVGIGQREFGGSGGMAMGTFPSFEVVFYDTSLKKLYTVNLGDVISSNEMIMSEETISVSQDGKKIAYATDRGLSVYNVQTGKKTLLLDFTAADNSARKGIVLMEQIAFVSSDKSIAFKAQSFDVPAVDGKNSFDTFGVINADGSGLSNIKSDKMTVKSIIAYSDVTLLTDDYVSYTGNIMVMNNATQKTTVYSLQTKKESSVVFGSDNGRYFASAVIESGSLHIRVYSMDTGNLVYEKTISADSAHLTRDPVVRVLDGSNTVIILLGNRQKEIDTQFVIDQF
jgi:hypothetical protein